MSQTDHAARLREVAEQEKGMATILPAGTMHSLCLSDAATFIAGAEAIEKCEKLRVFAEELRNDGNPVLLGFAYFIQKILHGDDK